MKATPITYSGPAGLMAGRVREAFLYSPEQNGIDILRSTNRDVIGVTIHFDGGADKKYLPCHVRVTVSDGAYWVKYYDNSGWRTNRSRPQNLRVHRSIKDVIRSVKFYSHLIEAPSSK